MRIAIVGAGPGGLYFASLMKRREPAHDVVVFERNLQDETVGCGVAFGHSMLETLRATDPVIHEALVGKAVTWDRIAVCHRNERVEIRGEPSVGLDRSILLGALRARAASLGVTLHFDTPVRDVRALPDADLVVGADGAQSLVREAQAGTFEPTLRAARNRFAWFSVNHRVEMLTLAFRRAHAGVFAAHAYPIEDEHSAVIIECGERTWARAGLDRRTDPDACSYLSDVFESQLGGHLLRPHGPLWWRPFLLVENARWHAGHTVLIGDALHTVHFSTGAGTQQAIEDAIALASAIETHAALPAAFDAFEAARRPAAEAARTRAHASLEWFEGLDRVISLSPVDLAFEALTATRRLDVNRLAELDPAFAARVGRPAG